MLKLRWWKKCGPVSTGRGTIEAMEARVLFSALTPAQVRHFYGVDNISFNGITGNGSGQTIAIVDAYDQPELIDSNSPNFNTSDLHNFDVMFGLPDPPSFEKIDENGGTNTPTDQVSGWSYEESLDVEWAHAMAPQANIVLVECDSNNDSDLFTGVAAAQNYPGVSVVSMSFDETPEPSDIVSRDSLFASTTGITYIASAGDYGSDETGYPAFSSYVIGVGGTLVTLADSSGDYGSEVVWNDNNGLATGGAPSRYEPQPSYQSKLTVAGSFRAVPDVAFDADPASGVYVYDSAVNPSGGHGYNVGGTSVGSPCWAGLVADADQGRALEGLSTLDGYSQTLPRLYTLSSNDFHDITSGNNDGYYAGTGYDLCTGLGTPIANLLVPDLAGGDTITGRVFVDDNSDGIYDGSDTPIYGTTVYLDLKNSGFYQAGDPTAVTNSSGIYTFTDQEGSQTGTVRLMHANGYVQDSTSAAFTTSYDATQTINLGLFPITYSTTTPAAHYTLTLNPAGTLQEVLINGTLTYSIAADLTSSMTFSLAGTGDSLTIDATNGNPLPSSQLTFVGSGSGDLLTVIGTASSNDSFGVTSSTVSLGSGLVQFYSVSQLILNPGAGTSSVVVYSGSATIAAQSPGLGILKRQFSTLSVASGASLLFARSPAHADRTLVETASLSVSGRLDLGGDDMIVHNGNVGSLNILLTSGFANGAWNGIGIASSAATADTTHLTALGIATNNIDSGNTLYGGSGQSLFDGVAPLATDVLIKYTYYGDANLDGKVDGTDYSRIDNAVLMHLTGWYNGDFNYDGSVNGSDYSLIDNAFNTQGAPM